MVLILACPAAVTHWFSTKSVCSSLHYHALRRHLGLCIKVSGISHFFATLYMDSSKTCHLWRLYSFGQVKTKVGQ